MSSGPKILVSACLAGKPCRYDGGHCSRAFIQKLVDQNLAIPVCPEELGGLPTPRLQAEQKNGRVVSATGRDLTAQYQAGARKALEIQREHNCELAYLKSRSPMCGLGQIFDGSFGGVLAKGDGVFAKMLKKSIKTVSVD